MPYDGPGALGEPLERRMERLRGDREAHSRKQIWTKEPHGGAYRKVSTVRMQPSAENCQTGAGGRGRVGGAALPATFG